MAFRLKPVSFEALPGWGEDDPAPVANAMARCAARVIHVKPYRTGSAGIGIADLMPALRATLDSGFDAGETAAAARTFFERHFRPFRIEPEDTPKGFVTGYYEPHLAVSARRTADYKYPVHAVPDDLVKIDDASRPAGMDSSFAFARRAKEGLSEYPDRREIESGCLEGRGLEIAFAADPVDLFFVHIQGSARLVYPDGKTARITYAAKTGHPFTAIGRLLVERGELDPAAVTMDTIRRWLADRPDRAAALMQENRSYIFFRTVPVNDDEAGPIGAAKVALTPGRSLAVDRTIHTFATPFFIDAGSLDHLDGPRPFRRLMLAEDTGSAIVGPARGDIFIGSGDRAGRQAGSVSHGATFHMLVPRPAAERFI